MKYFEVDVLVGSVIKYIYFLILIHFVSEHSSSNHTTFCGIDKDTGELVVINEWNVEIKNEGEAATIQKQINSIEQELNYLNKLKHQNLARYYSLKHEVNDNSVIVSLLREYVYGRYYLIGN